MARDPAEIRAEIERTREEIARSLGQIRTQVAEATDWRVRVRRQPLAFLGAAFAVGLFIGVR